MVPGTEHGGYRHMSLRQAATVCVIRPAATGFEVLLGKRGQTASFVGGAHVFPGGSVDEIDIVRAGPAGDPSAYAAVRETFEEMAIALTHPQESRDEYRTGEFGAVAGATDPSRLLYLSTWVTPAFSPIRFDTRFYLCTVASSTTEMMDGHEFVSSAWATPAQALENIAGGLWLCVSPTVAHLNYLSAFGTIDALIQGVRSNQHRDLIDQFVVAGHRPEGVKADTLF